MTDYRLDNEQLYTKAFMELRAYKLFITIPHTDLTPKETTDAFKTYKQVVYCKAAQEHHEDGDTHIHIYISFKQQVKYSQVMKLLSLALNGRIPRGAIDFRKPESTIAVCKYIDKEGNTDEFGERPLKVGKQEGRQKTDIGYKEAIVSAQRGNIEEAKEILLENQPRDMLINGANIIENLTKLNNTRKKYELPIYTQENTTLRPWQEQLIKLVQQQPKKRRIIWVVGEPESGKTFIHDYLSNIENYEYGFYDAGQSVSYDNVVYGYDEEGIISWDFPMSYDWETYGQQAGNLIEKFSDFGTSISSKKYKGSSKFVRGHCLVFSNREPLENISHREVVVIKATKEDKISQKTKVSNIDKIDKISPNKDKIMDKIDKIDSIYGKKTLDEIEENILKRPPNIKVDIFNPEMKHKEKIEKLLAGLHARLHFLESNNISNTEQELIKVRIEDLNERLKK